MPPFITNHPKAVILTGDHFASLKTFGYVWRHFWLSLAGTEENATSF